LSDRYGRIVAEAVTRGDAATVLTGEIGLRGGGTLYTRIGDVFGWIVVAAAGALAGLRSAFNRHPRA
jgi:apolipoprotein N-acyltransferase